jgi:adenine-specific DNA-methyltransferase
LELIAPTDPLSHSADLITENIERLRELFPQAVTEDGGGKCIDFDVLRELLGGELATGEEKYGLNWHGKRAARRLALTPSTGTLRPAPEDSVDWDTTQNLMIEGDNLEVLKLLQKSYAGKVKMIYIDPPYNTGKDFVYKDDFRDSIGNYQRITGQRDAEGAKLTTNAESSGRFHTDWLNMMYPRLMLGRNLLTKDGTIFISIDENELSRLIELCDAVFGEDAFAGCISRVTGTPTGGGNAALVNELDYVVAYFRESGQRMAGSQMSDEDALIYDQQDENGRYLTRSLRRTGGEDRREDRPTMFYAVYAPNGEATYPIAPTGYESRWICGEKRFNEMDSAGLIEWKHVQRGSQQVWHPYQKFYLEGRLKQPSNLWDDIEGNKKATRDVREMFDGERAFDHPKPLGLLEKLIAISGAEDAIVLDFFAGSGTTGHAILNRNLEHASNLKFILVQLPEPLDATEKKDAAMGRALATAKLPQVISELTKERLRRAAARIKAENPLFHGDLGFRVFKLDTTSIRPWDPTLPVTEQRLLGEVDNILPGRTEQDLLYELLLKRGLELTVPIVERTLAGKQVFAVSTGDLIACLAPHIESADVEALAEGIVTWHKELAPPPAVDPNAPLEKPAKFDPPLVVFRDTAFADDVAKSNLTEILKQHSLTDVRSL